MRTATLNEQTIEELRARFGNHSKVAEMLGMSVRNWRRIRQVRDVPLSTLNHIQLLLSISENEEVEA